ncbi:hypothetical protein BDQ17DRAFT_368488 [Cyathus striatus]|nr:hypothetical protein BDQ17DRAFT_368488 [Cyathus striatus]
MVQGGSYGLSVLIPLPPAPEVLLEYNFLPTHPFHIMPYLVYIFISLRYLDSLRFVCFFVQFTPLVLYFYFAGISSLRYVCNEFI